MIAAPDRSPTHLFLDHFYAGIDPETFEQLTPLKGLIPMTEVRTTASNDDEWTGIYLFAASGIYLELLERNETRPRTGLGLAFSGMGTESGVEDVLRTLHADFDWMTTEISPAGGSPWFLLIEPRLDPSEKRIRTWAMEYQEAARERRQSRIGARETPIQDFTGMTMHVPADLFPRLAEEHHGWIPARKSVEENRYRAWIERREEEPFLLDVTADRTITLPRVTRIDGTVKKDRELKPFRNGAASIEVRENEFMIVFA